MTPLQESLKKCKISGVTLFLPPISDGVLSNYNEVKNALLKAGAKYKQNCFIFPSDAQPYIDRLMGGENVNTKKEFQFFGTPSKLADELVDVADVKKSHKILEPSAGQGAIVYAISKKIPNALVYCCELMDINRTILTKHSNTCLICADFMNLPRQYEGYFDRIIANPPFNKNQDIDHIYKMYSCLKKGGRLVSIASKSWKIGSQKKQIEFREWLENVGATIEEIENGTFKESGTNVGGFVIIIVK